MLLFVLVGTKNSVCLVASAYIHKGANNAILSNISSAVTVTISMKASQAPWLHCSSRNLSYHKSSS
jgi:hypothetical protein